jgi:hypothetical protein
VDHVLEIWRAVKEFSSRMNLLHAAEDSDRAEWIAEVVWKLGIALDYAARGKTYEWNGAEIGPDLDPDPTSDLWPPDIAQAWPEPPRPGFPPLPGSGASFEDFKRYANIAMWADFYLIYDEAFDELPISLRLTETEAWALAEVAYDHRFPRQEDNRA